MSEGDDLVSHVPATAPAHLDHVIRIGNAGLYEIIRPGHHIQMRVLKVVSNHVAQKRIAVAGASSIIRLQDYITFGRQYGHVILGTAEAELVGRLWTAVRLNNQR